MSCSDEAGTFGVLLRQHRQDAGLTQSALAERAGLSARGVQNLERGLSQPYRDTARRLAEGMDLYDVLQALGGSSGSAVTVTVRPPGGQASRDVSIERAPVRMPGACCQT